MMPQIAKVKPAGVIKVGYMLETSALVLPPSNVVLTTKPFTTTITTKATKLST